MIRWYAVHCQPLGEAKARFNLQRQGYQVYLPQYLKRRRHARRTDWVRAALFPRYLFVALDDEHTRWRPINSTVGVSSIVGWGDTPTPVPDWVMDEIRAREDKDGLVALGACSTFRKGDEVHIVRGPMADSVGVFDAVADQERVVVLLSLMGRQVKVRVPTTSISAYA